MESLEKIAGLMVGILINASSKDFLNTFRAARIYNKAEIDYFGRKLTEKEREESLNNKDYVELVKKNLEKAGLESHYKF